MASGNDGSGMDGLTLFINRYKNAEYHDAGKSSFKTFSFSYIWDWINRQIRRKGQLNGVNDGKNTEPIACCRFIP